MERRKAAWSTALFLVVAGAALVAFRREWASTYVLGLLFLASLFAIARLKGLAQNIFLSVAVLLFAAVVAEIVARLSEPAVSTESKPPYIASRPTIGWGPPKAGTYHVRRLADGKVIYDATYTIDDHLLRKTESAASGKGVAFLGDSMIFGEGLADGETLPQQYADLQGRKMPVENFGFSGYSPAQTLAEMQAGMFDGLFAKSGLFVEFLAAWHAERVTCKASFVWRAPHYVATQDGVRLDGHCPLVPDAFLATYRKFIRPHLTTIRDDDIAQLVAIATATIKTAREKYKAPVTIFYARDPHYLRHLTWTDDKIIAAMRAAGADVVEYSLDKNPAYEIAGDGHPTALANAVRAKRLIDFERREQTPTKASDAGGSRR